MVPEGLSGIPHAAENQVMGTPYLRGLSASHTVACINGERVLPLNRGAGRSGVGKAEPAAWFINDVDLTWPKRQHIAQQPSPPHVYSGTEEGQADETFGAGKIMVLLTSDENMLP